MKLHSSAPTPQKYSPAPARGVWLRRRLVPRLFSARTAWWVFVVIVAVFAFTVVKMFRRLIETALQ